MLRHCWFGLNQQFRKKIQPIALTTVQYTVLRTLYERFPKPINQCDLSKLISSNKNNISSILKRLQALQYVKTSVNKSDKREKQISISATGVNTFFSAKEKADEVKKALFQSRWELSDVGIETASEISNTRKRGHEEKDRSITEKKRKTSIGLDEPCA